MSAADRVAAAAEATASSVRDIRPLALPDDSAAPARRGHRRRQRPLTRVSQTWLVPLGAAAAVAALALVLVILRQAGPPRPDTASSTSTTAGTGTIAVAGAADLAGIPRYYAIATEGPVSHAGTGSIVVTVGDTRTGKTVAAVTLPAISEVVGMNNAVGVSAAGDDRTFIVGRRDTWGDVDYFAVRLTTGAKPAVTAVHLPIPETAVGTLLGFAVSPDGKDLAVLSVRGNGTTLRVYSVATGAALRTWIAGAWKDPAIGLQFPGVSWTADSRQVAFSTPVTTGTNQSTLVERRIGATAPSGDLASASTVVFKAPADCSSLLLAPDGGTVVCGTESNEDAFPASPAGCGTSRPMLVAYSAATGQRLRVLFEYPRACLAGVYSPLWTDDSARHVIAEAQATLPGSPRRYLDAYGVAAAGEFATFPVALHGQWYSGPAF